MKNIVSYINEYGDKSFKEERINEVDYAILSILSYINFDGILYSNDIKVKLNEAIKEFFTIYTKKELNRHGFGLKDAYKIINELIDKKRYKDLELYNYVYITDHEIQFSAMFIDIDKNNTFISIEGTDDEVSGWKEDFELSYRYPIPAQEECIRYLNKKISLFSDRKYVISGHSKGGNLALVGAMNLNLLKQHKIKNIYSFDGPGLRKKEYGSYKFKYIQKRYISIIPNYSIVGLLLNNTDNYKIVSSYKKGLLAHSIYNWRITNNKFYYVRELSPFSVRFDEALSKWLDELNDQEKEEVITDIFSIFDRCNIESLESIHAADIKAILSVVKESSNVSDKTREVVKDFINLLLTIVKDNAFAFIKSKQD